jgi:hypothetical protein
MTTQKVVSLRRIVWLFTDSDGYSIDAGMEYGALIYASPESWCEGTMFMALCNDSSRLTESH